MPLQVHLVCSCCCSTSRQQIFWLCRARDAVASAQQQIEDLKKKVQREDPGLWKQVKVSLCMMELFHMKCRLPSIMTVPQISAIRCATLASRGAGKVFDAVRPCSHLFILGKQTILRHALLLFFAKGDLF